MAKIDKDYPITDLSEDWEGHSGGQVQEFIKERLNFLQHNIGKVPELEQQINDNLNYKESGYYDVLCAAKDFEGTNIATQDIWDTQQIFVEGDSVVGIWLYIPSKTSTAHPKVRIWKGAERVKEFDLGVVYDGVVGWRYFELETPITYEDGMRVSCVNPAFVGYVSGDRYYSITNSEYKSQYSYSFVFVKRTYVEAITMKQRMDEIDEVAKLVTPSINILIIGNSFSRDCMSYAPFILNDICPNLKYTIGIAYRGAASLDEHLAMAKGEDDTKYLFYKIKSGQEAWMATSGTEPDAVYNAEKWDVVILQQYSMLAANEYDEYFKPYINEFINVLQEKLDHPFKLGWNINHSRVGTDDEDTKAKFVTTAENSKRIMEHTACELLIPYGTAIANARSTKYNDLAIKMSVDNAHLAEGLPKYIASCVSALKMLEFAGLKKISIMGNTLQVTDEWVAAHNIPRGNEVNPCVGISDQAMYDAQMCAVMAIKNPYIETNMVEENIIKQ